MQQVAKANNTFGLKLFQTRISEKPENIFISPYSLGTALNMLAVGASGESLEQLKSGLQWDHMGNTEDKVVSSYSQSIQTLNSSQDIKLLVGNSVWCNSLKKAYVTRLQKDFHAEALPLTTADKINQWVSKQTNGLIKEIIQDIDRNTLALLINAIYFKGTWKYQFKSHLTKKKPFTPSNGSQKQVDTMTMKRVFKHTIGDNYSAVELPYQGDSYSMVAILPANESAASFSKTLTAEKFSEISTGLRSAEVTIHLPKFKLEYGVVEMKKSLEALGITQIYSKDDAKLDRMSDDPTAHVSSVFHKAVCIVNEEGTEAAAVTAVVVSRCCAVLNVREIKFDRPFVFAIKETATNMILFVGLVENPA